MVRRASDTTVGFMSAALFCAYGESVQNIGGSVGGTLAPLVTGLLVQRTHSFVLAFYVTAAAAVLSGISYALVKHDAYAGMGERG